MEARELLPKPGGLSSEMEVTDKVREIVKQLHSEVEKKADNEFEKLEPIVYRQQVVAGFNYWVKVRAIDKDTKEVSYLHLRIYRPAGRQLPLELTSLRLVGDEKEKLDYFP